MHFYKRESGVTGLALSLLLVFALLFILGGVLHFKDRNKTPDDVSSDLSSEDASESPSFYDESESDVSKMPPLTYEDVFAAGYDIRRVDSSCPVSVPEGKGAIAEETRQIRGDFSSSDGLVSVLNKTLFPLNLSIDSLLTSYEGDSHEAPTVVIYHTHTSEGYEERLNSYYSLEKSGLTEDSELNVLAVGKVLKNRLEAKGIRVIHITDVFDSPSRSGSFKRSQAALEKRLKNEKNIALVIDLHRGTVQRTGGDRVKPTVYANGRKAAQISLIACCDADNSLGFPDWETKLALSLALQKECSLISPLLMTPVSLESQKYNLSLSYPCVMAEIGTDVNTIDEAKLSAALFADAVASFLSYTG